MSQDEEHVKSANRSTDVSASKLLGGKCGLFATLEQRINDNNAKGCSVRVEWSYKGKTGKGKLTNIDTNGDHIEFFVTDDNSNVGSFTLISPRTVTAVSPQEEDDLCIFSPYIGNIKILHNT